MEKSSKIDLHIDLKEWLKVIVDWNLAQLVALFLSPFPFLKIIAVKFPKTLASYSRNLHFYEIFSNK